MEDSVGARKEVRYMGTVGPNMQNLTAQWHCGRFSILDIWRGVNVDGQIIASKSDDHGSGQGAFVTSLSPQGIKTQYAAYVFF